MVCADEPAPVVASRAISHSAGTVRDRARYNRERQLKERFQRWYRSCRVCSGDAHKFSVLLRADETIALSIRPSAAPKGCYAPPQPNQAEWHRTARGAVLAQFVGS